MEIPQFSAVYKNDQIILALGSNKLGMDTPLPIPAKEPSWVGCKQTQQG